MTSPTDRLLERMAPRAVRVCPAAGDAVIFHCRTAHAGGGWAPGSMPQGRPGAFHSYRAAWAAPAGPVDEWAPDVLQQIGDDDTGSTLKQIMHALNEGNSTGETGVAGRL